MREGSRIHFIVVLLAFLWSCERTSPKSSTTDSSDPSPAANLASLSDVTQGTFAFVNSDGTRLLALDSLPEPSGVHGAVCSGAVVVPVRYDHRSTRQPNDNGRQVAANFANQQGDIFAVTANKALPDQTCYLSADSLLLAGAQAVTMRQPADCSPGQLSRTSTAKGRPVVHCWNIASAPTGLEVLVVQFADADSAALASLVVFGDSGSWFKDFPAVRRANDESTWRVNDEGVFSPTGFDVPFIAHLRDGFVIALTWAGAEGEDSELMRADSTPNLRTLSKAYRYWSPA